MWTEGLQESDPVFPLGAKSVFTNSVVHSDFTELSLIIKTDCAYSCIKTRSNQNVLH